MNIIVDRLDSVTGWTESTGANHPEVVGLNAVGEYIAGANDFSIVFEFFPGGNGQYVEKVLNVDVSQADEFIFHVWSRRLAGNEFTKASDFKYKVTLAQGHEFYFETRGALTEVVVDISGINTITMMRITQLHDSSDHLIISDAIAVRDEFPLDIFEGVRIQLEKDIRGIVGDGMLVGTVDLASEGDEEIRCDSVIPFLDRYAVVKIKDENGEEVHHLRADDRGVYSFTTLFDGRALRRSFRNANIYLTFPVTYGRIEDDIILPSIAIWGLTPEFILRGAKLDTIFDSFAVGGGPSGRTEGQILKYDLLLDCEARHYKLLAFMSSVVRKFIGRESLWINGRISM